MTLQSTNTQPVNEYDIPPDYSNVDPTSLDPYAPLGNPSGVNVTTSSTEPVKTMDWVTSGGPVEPDAPKGPQVDTDKPPANPYDHVALYDAPQDGGPFQEQLPEDPPLELLNPAGIAPVIGVAIAVGVGIVLGTVVSWAAGLGPFGDDDKKEVDVKQLQNGDLNKKQLIYNSFTEDGYWSGDETVTNGLNQTNALVLDSETVSPDVGIDANIIESVLGKGDVNGLPGVALGESQFKFVGTEGGKTSTVGGGEASSSAGSGGSTLEKAATSAGAAGNNDTLHFSNTSIDAYMEQFGLNTIDPALADILGEQDFGSQGYGVPMNPDLFSIAPPAMYETANIMLYDLTAA